MFGAELVYLRAVLLLDSPPRAPFRASVESARRQGAAVALELDEAQAPKRCLIKLDSRGCSVHGRRLFSSTRDHDGDALAAAFCVAIVDGAAPVEAARRAVLVASR